MRRRSVLLGLPFLAGLRPARSAPQAPVTALAFSPDGRFLVSSGYREIVVGPISGAAERRRIPCELAQIHDVAFSPDGSLLAAAGGTPGSSGAAHLLTWPGGKRVSVLGAYRDLANGVAFSPDGKRVVVTAGDRLSYVWDPGKPAPVLTLAGHAGPVLGAAYAPDGKLLVTAGADRSLRVWDAVTGEMQRSLTNHTGIVHCVAFRPLLPEHGNPHPYCASGSDDRTARVWQPGLGRMVRIVRGHAGPVLAVVYSRDGKHLFTAGTEGVVRVIDADSDQVVRTWKASEQWIYSLALSPDGHTLAAGDWKGQVRPWIWEART